MKEIFLVIGLASVAVLLVVTIRAITKWRVSAKRPMAGAATAQPVIPLPTIAPTASAPPKDGGTKKISIVGLAGAVVMLSCAVLICAWAYGLTKDTSRREALVSAEIAAIGQGQRFVRERQMQTVIELAPGTTSEPILIRGSEGPLNEQAADWWPKTDIPEIELLEIIPITQYGLVAFKTNSYAYTPRGTPRRSVDRYIAFRNHSPNARFTIEFVRGTTQW